MTEDLVRARMRRMQRQVEILEKLIDDRSREVSLTRESLDGATEFLHEIFKTMPGALFVLDAQGNIETVNDAAIELMGYTRDELVGHPMRMLFQSGHCLTSEEIASLLDGGTVLRTEKACLTRDGAQVHVLLSASRLGKELAPEAPPRFVCIALDISYRKKLEVELRQAQKLESVGQLAAGIAHEINTPVQFVGDSIHFVRDAVRDMLQIMARYEAVCRCVPAGTEAAAAAAEAATAAEQADLHYVTEEIPRALERALEGLGRVATIVRSMKEFARPDRSEMQPVDLNRAIQSTLTISRNEYKYVAELQTDFEDLPPVICHGSELNQAILNIVVNAAHAIGEVVQGTDTKGRITVRTRREGASVLISVEDTGTGIPTEIRDHVFDLFFTTKEPGKGTGQGLAIAHSVIVDKHGGHLSFESQPGVGTTFFIRLPIAGKESQRVEVAP